MLWLVLTFRSLRRSRSSFSHIFSHACKIQLKEWEIFALRVSSFRKKYPIFLNFTLFGTNFMLFFSAKYPLLITQASVSLKQSHFLVDFFYYLSMHGLFWNVFGATTTFFKSIPLAENILNDSLRTYLDEWSTKNITGKTFWSCCLEIPFFISPAYPKYPKSIFSLSSINIDNDAVAIFNNNWRIKESEDLVVQKTSVSDDLRTQMSFEPYTMIYGQGMTFRPQYGHVFI